MNRFLLLIIISCLIVSGSFFIPSTLLAADTINWYSYEDGLAQAKAQKKKIYINFHADWCGYCHKMERETFKDSKVIAFLNTNYIPIRINSDKEKNLARQYHVRGLPDNIFMEEGGQSIGNQPGYLGPSDFLKVIQYVYEEKYKSSEK
jgi:thioredoxin-related protein